MSRIVVTGAGGFIGKACVAALVEAGHEVAACLRRMPEPDEDCPAAELVIIPDLADPGEKLAAACEGADVVIHLADNPDRTASGEYPSKELALAVADAARAAEVPRLIMASSIYARFDAEGADNPYGAAKRRGEMVLQAVEGADTLILRLPPVYGPGAKGGIALLAGLVRRGWPLPFGSANAPRDYLALSNLAALLVALVEAQPADFAELSSEPREPSDGAPIATRDLAQAIAQAIGRRARLIPVPSGILKLAGAAAGKGEQVAAIFVPLETRPNDTLLTHTRWRPVSDWSANLAYLASEGAD